MWPMYGLNVVTLKVICVYIYIIVAIAGVVTIKVV